jgi:hypothetical protein
MASETASYINKLMGIYRPLGTKQNRPAGNIFGNNLQFSAGGRPASPKPRRCCNAMIESAAGSAADSGGALGSRK